MAEAPFEKSDAEDLDEFRRTQRRSKGKILLLVLAVVAIIGLMPLPFGGGLFGYRLFQFDRVQLYLANGVGEGIIVDVSTGPRTEFADAAIGNLTFRAGDVELVAYLQDGSVLESFEFFTDNKSVFYNPSGALCFAVMDISALYGGQGQEPIELIDGITSDDRIYRIPNGSFVAPRGTAPEHAPQGTQVVWIDDVACELLDEVNHHILLAQQRIRMRERMERRRQLLNPD